MNLKGLVNFKGENYFVINKKNASTDNWIILSPISRADSNRKLLGKPMEDKVLDSSCRGATVDHIVEYYSKKTKTGKVDVMKKRRTDIVNLIVDSIITFKIYGYQDQQVITNDERVTPMGKLRKDFEARTPQFDIKYTTLDKEFTYLRFRSSSISFELLDDGTTVTVPRIGADLIESADRTFKERVFFTNVADINFETLAKSHDLSWYKHKDYKMVESNEQFETLVMTPLLRAIKRNIELGEKTLLAMDTETTGLGIFKLFAGSEEKDHIVTMQLSWEDNQSVLINFDMEVFDNVDHDYVRDRLHPIVKEYIGNDRNKPITLETMEGEKVTFCRNDILVIGHNTIFDGKVTIDMGAQWFFDEDTLEMIFDLNAGDSKGEKGLKKLSRRLLGIDQLQLSDTLGKNNEDKFRYITDRRVALVYGGADSDCTRLVWKELYKVMPQRVYKAYKKYHMYMWYILAQSEYDGIKLKEDVLKKNATIVEHNLQAIENFIYTYVGRKIIQNEIKNEIRLEVEQGATIANLKEEYYRRLEGKDLDKAIHRFNINGADVRDILYETLGYPVIAYTDSGLPATNKDTLMKLSRHTRKSASNDMQEHLVSEDGETILIDKDKFNNYKFPLCYVLLKYKDLYKEYRGYYLPFQKSDMGGYLYKGFSTTNIETFRISNPVQTTKKDLKKCIGAYGEDWYPVNWDMAQVEARVFVSMAHDERMIERLNDSENDYHTETAAAMYSIPPYTVTKPLRKASKTINFGLPYGLGDKKMCERIHGVINDENLFDTQLKIEMYKKTNAPTWNLLEGFRDSALDIWDCPDDLRRVIGAENKILGRVQNAVGLYRVFDLTNVTENWQKASVRRAAGNFPIQSFAACIFKLIIIRLFIRMGKEGLRDKFKIHMLVHDEIQCSVHKSIDPVYLMKLFKEECMIHIKGHATYFIGINFGDSWYQCKQDENECPVNFVLEMIHKLETGEYKAREWTDNPKEILDPAMHQFFKNRIYREFVRIQPTISRYVDYDKILEGLTSYTVRAYVTDKFQKAFSYDKDDADEAFLSHLIGWTYEYFQVDDFDIVYKNKAYRASQLIALKNGEQVSSVFDTDVELFEEEISEENWDLDDNESVSEFFVTKYTIEEDDDEDEDPRTDIEKMLDGDFVEETYSYKNLEVRKNLVFVRVDNLVQLNQVKSQVTHTQHKDAITLKFEIRGFPRGSVRVPADTNLAELDSLVTKVKASELNIFDYGQINSFK